MKTMPLNWNMLLLAIGVIRFIHRIVLLSAQDYPYDILINLNGVRALQQGLPLYVWSPETPLPSLFNSFISSPFVAVLFHPLTSLNETQVIIGFRVVSILLYLLGVFLLSRANQLKIRDSAPAFGLFWLIALSWEPAFNSIGLGQLNELLLPCFALAYWGWIRRDDRLTGIGGALLAAIKVSPVLLAGYWLIRRNWKAPLITFLLGGVIGVGSCVYVSWGQCVTFLTTIFPAISQGTFNYYNTSPNGFLTRIYADVPNWYILDFSPTIPIVRIWMTILSVVLILGVVFLVRKYRGDDARHLGLEFSLALMVIILISPVAWWHYLVWLIVAFGALFRQDTLFQLSATRRNFVLGLILGGVLLMSFSPDILINFATAAAMPLSNFIISLALFGQLLLLGSLLVVYASLQREPSV